MPHKPSIRVALTAACLLIALGVFAGTSAGSAASPPASAPRLLAHDTSSFGHPARRKAKPGPQLLQPARKKHGAKPGKTPVKIYFDRALTDPSVLNPSSDIGKTQLLLAHNGRYSVYSRTWVATGGPSLGSMTSATFWSGLTGPDPVGLCATHPQGEPSVAYDWSADRWVISEAAYLPRRQQQADRRVRRVRRGVEHPGCDRNLEPLRLPGSTAHVPEHPTLGVWSDGYYLSFDQHTSADTWAGAGALALERSKMLTGAAAQARYFDLGNVSRVSAACCPRTSTGQPRWPVRRRSISRRHDDR